MHVMTRKNITAIALAWASITSGLVLVGAGARLASAGPDTTGTPITCNQGPCTTCDQWGCGSNSAEVQGKPIGALHLEKEPNSAGFRIDPFLYKRDNKYPFRIEKYPLRIENGEIIGMAEAAEGGEVPSRDGNMQIEIAGNQLQGSWFMLRYSPPPGPGGAAPIAEQTEWKVRIDSVAVVRLFAVRTPPGDPEYAFAYELALPDLVPQNVVQAADAGLPGRDLKIPPLMPRAYVCPEVSAWGWETYDGLQKERVRWKNGEYPLLSWEKKFGRYSVLVKGETYNPGEATVASKGADADLWFNIACAGTALAKMKLMGYDPEDKVNYPTTWEQRQTTLKMITARYCGSMSFTRSGQPLLWQNAKKWFRPDDHLAPLRRVGDVEAVWDENGAICLNEPRRKNEWTREAVIAACGKDIPKCDRYFRSPVAGQTPAGSAGFPKPLVPIDPRYYVPAGKEWVTRHISSFVLRLP